MRQHGALAGGFASSWPTRHVHHHRSAVIAQIAVAPVAALLAVSVSFGPAFAVNASAPPSYADCRNPSAPSGLVDQLRRSPPASKPSTCSRAPPCRRCSRGPGSHINHLLARRPTRPAPPSAGLTSLLDQLIRSACPWRPEHTTQSATAGHQCEVGRTARPRQPSRRGRRSCTSGVHVLGADAGRLVVCGGRVDSTDGAGGGSMGWL